jgi:hypothetical protein
MPIKACDNGIDEFLWEKQLLIETVLKSELYNATLA